MVGAGPLNGTSDRTGSNVGARPKLQTHGDEILSNPEGLRFYGGQ